MNKEQKYITMADIDISFERPKKKVLLIGHARHGKDTVADMMNEMFGYTSKASSMAAAEIFIFDRLKDEYGYTTIEECFDGRTPDNMRQLWYNLICEYNKSDKARLAKDIMSYNDIYTGMRDDEELWECNRQRVFDLIIGVYDPRKPPEIATVMKIDIWKESHIIIPNAQGLNELKERVRRLAPLL